MAVTNYYSVNGTLRGEDTSGTRLGYLTDALGSVTATIASDGVVQNTYRYKPYGQQLAKTGVGVDPKFQHAGDTGSRKTGLDYSEQYNQYRHLDTSTGRWTTVDLLWPEEGAYCYVDANPVSAVDPTGTKPIFPGMKLPEQKTKHTKRKALTKPWDSLACKKAYDAMLKALNDCFDPATAKLMAEIMQCIAFGESKCNPADHTGGYGLYQLGDKEIKRCTPSDCCAQYVQTQIGCNTRSTVGLIIWLLKMESDSTLGGVLCHYFGVLDCPPHHGKQNEQTANCLHAKNIDPNKIPRPTPKPGCDPCK